MSEGPAAAVAASSSETVLAADRAGLAGRSPAAPAPGVPESLAEPPILHLILGLLAELGEPTDTVEYFALPSVDQYAVRLPSTRGRGEAVLLPRRALEHALVDGAARRRLRNVLRAWVESPVARRALTGAAPLSAYLSALGVQALPGPRCACCQGPLLAEEPAVVHEASRSHLTCPPAW
jgi:hypothetical protein